MQYPGVVRASFIDRPNRFIAHVKYGGNIETVHVKNTGRCRELLLPGSEVVLSEPGTDGRKTRFDLIAVRKQSGLLVNIDSQAPNAVVREWLMAQEVSNLHPEYPFGQSRLDFRFTLNGADTLMEIKGCTLEREGIGYFPDAPTERGVRHLHELIHAVQEGFRAMLVFVVQMDGITEVHPNMETHPAFGEALEAAREAGVKVLVLPCHIEPDRIVSAPSAPALSDVMT